jgi:hypothetical protein
VFLTVFTALIAFVAFVTRVAAGFLLALAFDCRAFGVTFFVAILIHLPPLAIDAIMNRQRSGLR